MDAKSDTGTAATLTQAEEAGEAFSLHLDDPKYQFPSVAALEAFLRSREDAHFDIVTGIGYYVDKAQSKKPLGNFFSYEMWSTDPSDLPKPEKPLSLVEVTEPDKWDAFAESHADTHAFIDHSDVILVKDARPQVVEVALIREYTKPFPKVGVWVPSPDAKPLVDKILSLPAIATVAQIPHWKNQGRAPIGYIKGMALVFARAYSKLKMGDPSAKEMARTSYGDPGRDALAFFDQTLTNAGLPQTADESDTLRRLFTVLTGLGMPESAGKYWEGKDPGAKNTAADTCEAGLFQTSWNAHSCCNDLMAGLLEQYNKDNDSRKSGMLEVFKEGVEEKSTPSYGDPRSQGFLFQEVSKACPAFTAEFTAVGLRNLRRHWGTIASAVRPRVEDSLVDIKRECGELMRAVQNAVDEQFRTKAVQV